MNRAEQIRGSRYASPGERREMKRRARRARRRAEKSDPESAPTRMREVTYGWVD